MWLLSTVYDWLVGVRCNLARGYIGRVDVDARSKCRARQRGKKGGEETKEQRISKVTILHCHSREDMSV